MTSDAKPQQAHAQNSVAGGYAMRPARIPLLRLRPPVWLDTLFNAGIVTADPAVRRRQRFTNIAALCQAFNAVAHFTINAVHDFQALLPVNIYNAVVFIVFLSLHRLHRFGGNVAANVLVVISLIGHAYVVFALGLASNLHVYFTLAGVVFFLIGVDHWRNFLALFLFAVATLLVTTMAATRTGFVMEWDTAFRESLANQALLTTIVLNAIVIAFALTALDRAERTLRDEYERSELLLTTILPKTIAERLKSGREKRIADHLDGITVMFIDLVGFTPAAASASAEEVVDYLHRLYVRFDALCEEHEIDKIKTIGDSYMVVGGLRGGDDDPAAAIRLALRMLDILEEEPLAGHRLSMRCGIHYGPAVAGVIGDRRISYDIWGDTVNTASRLEGTGLPGRIHVSADYRRLIGPQFTFEARGPVELKGLGRRETFLLAGDAQPSPREA